MPAGQRHKRYDPLTLQIVGTADNSGLGDSRMADEGAFDLHGPYPMAGNVDDVVNAPHNPEIPVFIAPRAIAREIDAFNIGPVLLFEAFRIAVDGSHHGWPRTFQNQKTALIRTNGLTASIHNVGNDPG